MSRIKGYRLAIYALLLLQLAISCTSEKSGMEEPNFHFDGRISEEVLRNYLDRSVTMAEFCVKPELSVDGQESCYEDDIRLIKNIRPKFIGRTLFRWGKESDLNNPDFLPYARKVIEEVHAFDSDVVFQAAVFEAVSRDVENVSVPARVFEAFGLPVEERNFDYESMLFSSGLFVGHWGEGSSVPDVNMLESRMWFYFLATKYIETGFEGIHWGQVALMGAEDPNLDHWFEMVGMIREYAKKHARRHFVLHDAHSPWGGFLREGIHLLDFNSFPLRIVPGEEYMEGILPEERHLNSIYNHSKGGETPSGWSCESLPYIVEFDNFGISKNPGQRTDGPFIWGYDEITWFSLKRIDEQKKWLEYAHNWVRTTDPNGYLQMPVSRVLVNGVDKTDKYKANVHSEACPTGTGLETKIKQLWDKSEDVLYYVDPMIGADFHGHVFVGANVPFGGVQVGPTNFSRGWDWCSGYHYSDSIVRGFSQLHLSGTGIGDLGDVLVMPAVGERRTDAGTEQDISNAYSSKYRHSTEEVSPGYYRVELEKYNIKVELTATERVAFHRYTFPESENARVVIDLGEGINWDAPVKTYLHQINESTFEGYRYSRGWADDQREFFILELSKPVSYAAFYKDGEEMDEDEVEGTVVKGFLEFETEQDEIVLMKIGMSGVSMDGAKRNLEAELPAWDFDATLVQAQDKWRQALSRITIKSKDLAKKRIFYTAMYHSKFVPNLFSDVDGSYRGADYTIYPDPGYETYTVFSLWDTYRAANPLFTLTAPERVGDMVRTMLAIYQEQGKLPVWHLRGAETNCMVGYSAIPVVVDACFKGIWGIDHQLAYEAVKATARGDFEPGVREIMECGYIPADKMKESVARAMEYAISDWAVAQLAKKLGKEDDFEYFSQRAKAYTQYFDEESKFMRGKLENGKWRLPFDPVSALHRDNDYCEGNAWQYLWLVPQDPEGLIQLLGGDEPFTKKLDELFSVSSELQEGASVDITGLIGQYAHGNEPSHATVYLYSYAGQQYKTAKLVHQINTTMYTDQPDGICGNEDAGQMSAWYILSSMGFYPVNAASGMYVFGSPLFEEVTIAVPGDNEFVIRAEAASDENIYIQSVSLNGRPHTKSFITHKEIIAGGELVFEMGPTPNKAYGKPIEDRPQSKIY